MSDPTSPAVAEDPFRLGWRYVREIGPDGQETLRQVPLTERDLLFPQEEDFVVQRDPHTRDMLYLREAFRTFLQDRPAVHVFADHRIDFNLSGVEPLGPDVAVIDDVPEWTGEQGTLYLAEQGRPLLVVEITSPDTRRNDLGIKREFYARAGVPVYVIVDHQAGQSRDEVALTVLRLNGEGYAALAADGQGRVGVPQLGISIGIEDEAVWLYSRSGKRLEEMPRLVAMIEEAQLKAEELAARQAQLEAHLEQEIDLRRSEAASRREAEAKRHEAEKARQQAEDARQEADAARQQADVARQQADVARQEAEAALAREREATQALEQRLRALEEQLRRAQPED